MIAKAARQLPPQMPSPPSYQKVNPADQPVMFLVLRSATLPLSTVNEYAETMLAQRISMVSGVAQVQIYGAARYAVRVDLDPRQLAGVRHRHRRSGDRDHERQRQPADRNHVRRGQDVHGPGQRPAAARRGVRADDRRVPQRQAGAAGRSGARVRRRRERQDRRLVQRRPRDHPGDPEAAGHQRRRGGRRGQARCCRRSASSCRPSISLDVRSDRAGPIRDSVRDVKFTLLLTVGPGRPGDLPVPAEHLGDDHPEPRAARLDRRRRSR